MSNREKLMLSIGGFVLIARLFFVMVIAPVQERSVRLKRMLVQRNRDIVEIKRLKGEFDKIKKKFSFIEKKLQSTKGGFSNLTFIETIAQKSNVRDKITSIKHQPPIAVGEYKSDSLEIKMNGVKLYKLVEYLYRIENSEFWMKVNRLTLKTKYGEQKILDAKFFVVSFSKT